MDLVKQITLRQVLPRHLKNCDENFGNTKHGRYLPFLFQVEMGGNEMWDKGREEIIVRHG
jgi:hypothetical protein